MVPSESSNAPCYNYITLAINSLFFSRLVHATVILKVSRFTILRISFKRKNGEYMHYRHYIYSYVSKQNVIVCYSNKLACERVLEIQEEYSTLNKETGVFCMNILMTAIRKFRSALFG